MDNLIDKLREQHWDIISLCFVLEKFCKSGVGDSSDIEKWMEDNQRIVSNLKKFKTILVSHLGLEDKSLYPVLFKSKDKKTRSKAEKYADEMKLISKRTISFFETYEHLKVDELSQNENFKLDLNTVITIIRRRIAVEEAELYPLYPKTVKK